MAAISNSRHKLIPLEEKHDISRATKEIKKGSNTT
jgi:hypothetical protein